MAETYKDMIIRMFSRIMKHRFWRESAKCAGCTLDASDKVIGIRTCPRAARRCAIPRGLAGHAENQIDYARAQSGCGQCRGYGVWLGGISQEAGLCYGVRGWKGYRNCGDWYGVDSLQRL